MSIKSKIYYLVAILVVTAFLCPLAWAEKTSWSIGKIRVPSYTLEGSVECLRCHSGDAMHAMKASPHGQLNSPESSVATEGCELCHGPGSFHVSRAHGGKGFPPMTTFGRGSNLASREEQIGICLSCHENGSGNTDSIIWWGSVHDRRNINCSRCHLIHAEFDPIRDKKQQDKVCFKCHRKQKTRHPEFENKNVDLTTHTCSTCHDVHNQMKVIENQESNQEPNQQQ